MDVLTPSHIQLQGMPGNGRGFGNDRKGHGIWLVLTCTVHSVY